MVWLLTACVSACGMQLMMANIGGRLRSLAIQTRHFDAPLINGSAARWPGAFPIISIILIPHRARSHTDTRTHVYSWPFVFISRPLLNRVTRKRLLVKSGRLALQWPPLTWRRHRRRRTLRKRLRRARDANCHFICVEPQNACDTDGSVGNSFNMLARAHVAPVREPSNDANADVTRHAPTWNWEMSTQVDLYQLKIATFCPLRVWNFTCLLPWL